MIMNKENGSFGVRYFINIKIIQFFKKLFDKNTLFIMKSNNLNDHNNKYNLSILTNLF